MALTQTVLPAVEPLSLDDVKHYLRVDGTNDDSLISSLITTSRLHIEAALGLALITQGWRYQFSSWPKGNVILPLRPVQLISQITVVDHNDQPTQLATDTFTLVGSAGPASILIDSDARIAPGRKRLGIEIAFKAGYGDAPQDVPAPIRQALSLLVGHWYEHREAAILGERGARIPIGVNDLLAPYRMVQL